MSLGGLDKARAVEGLTWLLVAALNDGVPRLRASPFRASYEYQGKAGENDQL